MSMGGVLQAAGEAARAIETVSWVLIVGGFAIFAGVMLLLTLALRRSAPVRARLWILGGGLVFPTAVLAALYAWSLPMSPAWKPVPPADALVVTVTGHMWWWDVRYTARTAARCAPPTRSASRSGGRSTSRWTAPT